jgi:uncharacterized membrane protein
MSGHPGWGLGWLLPLLLTALVVGVAVWAVLRVTRSMPLAPTAAAPGSVVRPDGALEAARMRYASGDLAREDYRRVVRDLGGVDPGRGDPLPREEPPPTEPPGA